MCLLKFGFLALCVLHLTTAQDVAMLKKIKECLARDGSVICLKERALDILNETVMSDKPLSLYGVVDIIKNPEFVPNATNEVFLPRDLNQRTLALNDMLYDKVEEFFESRSVKINLGNVFEGRGRKRRGSHMMMMAGVALAGMMGQLFMGKIAFMAGAALLVAKLALLLSTIIGFKKLAGSTGGESSHVVYANAAETGYGHSHGGWQRSIVGEDTQNNPYRAHIQNEVADNYTY